MEDGGSLFVPDFLTPGQWRDAHRADGELGPVKRLMLAMLEGALIDLLGARRIGRRRRRWTAEHRAFMNQLRGLRAAEAAAWVFDLEADEAGLTFSFANACDVLGIDTDRLRRRLGERRSMAA